MKHMRLDQLARFALVATALAVPALVTPSTATAQGFGLNEIGSCSVGRAGSGVAAPCADASRIYWNPAAAVRLPGVHLLVGAADVMVNGSFAQDSTGRTYPGDVPAEYPPHLFATYQVLPRFNVGVGVFVPYGLTSQWTEDFPGRFSALKASLASIYIQPNFAYDLVPGKFAVGGGPVIGISDVELTQGIDLSQQSPQPGVTFGQLGIASGTEFARATLKGQSVALGYDLGVHWQLAPPSPSGPATCPNCSSTTTTPRPPSSRSRPASRSPPTTRSASLAGRRWMPSCSPSSPPAAHSPSAVCRRRSRIRRRRSWVSR